MKFGFRTPSLSKRISARTSPARFVRHSLGLKAPRGYGWLTDPKKALYNRIYNRTTFGIEDLMRAGRPRGPSAHAGVPEGDYEADGEGEGYIGGGGFVPRMNGLAIAGFICAFLCTIVGLPMSIVAYSQCKKSNGTLRGEGLAVAGIIVGSVMILINIIARMAMTK